MMDNILINFEVKSTGLEPTIDGIVQLETADKGLADQVKQTAVELNKRDKVLSDGAKAGKKDVEGLTAAFGNLTKAAVGSAYDKALKELQKNLKGTKDEFKQLNMVLEVAKKRLNDLDPNSAEWKQLNDQVKAGEQILRIFAEQEEETATRTKSLRTELRQLKEEIAERALAGETGPELDALIAKAGEFDDTLKDVNARISTTGSDTRNIEGFVQVLGTGVQAIAGMQAAQALLGDENEEFNRALAKMNALLVISNSVQAIQTTLQKESAASLLIENAQRKLAVLNIQLQSAAESKNTVVRYGAAAAQRVLNAVMAANPIGIVLVALAALASLVLVFTTNTTAAAKAQNDLNDALNQGGKFLDAELAGIERANKKIIAEMKARGASEKEITDQEISAERQKNEARKRTLENNRKSYDAIKALDEESLKSKNELADQNDKIDNDIKDSEVDIIVKRSDEIAAARQKAAEKTKVDHEKRLQKAKEYATKEAKAAADITKLSLEDQVKANQNTIDTSTDTRARLAALENLSALKKKILEEEKAFELKNTELTKKERELVEKSFDSKILDLTRETANSRTAIIKEGAERDTEATEKGLRDRQEAIDKAATDIQADFDYSQKKYQNEVLTNEAILLNDKSTNQQKKQALMEINRLEALQFDNQRILLERLHEAGKINTADYYTALADLDSQYLEKKNQKLKESSDKENETREKALNLTAQIAGGLFEIDRNRAQESIRLNQEMYDRRLITEKEFNARKEQIAKAQAVRDKQKALFDIGLEFAKALFKANAEAAFNPVSFGKIAFIVAEYGIASALVAARKYRHGQVGIEGPGTKTSDSIPAFISRGESVINADMTSKHFEALEAINSNRFKEYLDKFEAPKYNQNFTLPHISEADERRITVNNKAADIDYEKLGKVIAKEMADHPVLNLKIDNDGFNASVQKGLDTINYKNRKLNM